MDRNTGKFYQDGEGERAAIIQGRGFLCVEFVDSSAEEFEEAAEALHEQIWGEVLAEAREERKALAREAFNHADASCDAIAEQFGLSAHTVRGMVRGKGRRGGTDASQAGDLRQWVADDCGW